MSKFRINVADMAADDLEVGKSSSTSSSSIGYWYFGAVPLARRRRLWAVRGRDRSTDEPGRNASQPGRHHAGNSSQITDGAAVLPMMPRLEPRNSASLHWRGYTPPLWPPMIR